MLRGLLLTSIPLALLTACPTNPAPAKADAKGASKADAKTDPAKTDPKPDTKSDTKSDTKAPAADGPMGKALPDAPIPLAELFGAEPAKAETMFGDPIAKGGTKDSCVRFVPDRTWFKCKHAWQRYSDKTGTAESLYVTYEDGKVAAVAFEKVKGEGPFDPTGALKKVGLELPEPPTLKRPTDNVKLWSWFNAQARLVFGERQYRVEVSTVDDQWETSKVDIMLNDPLNDDEKARAFEVEPQTP